MSSPNSESRSLSFTYAADAKPCRKPAQRNTQLVFKNDRDDAEPARRKHKILAPVAFRDREEAREQIELVGERNADRDRRARHAITRPCACSDPRSPRRRSHPHLAQARNSVPFTPCSSEIRQPSPKSDRPWQDAPPRGRSPSAYLSAISGQAFQSSDTLALSSKLLMENNLIELGQSVLEFDFKIGSKKTWHRRAALNNACITVAIAARHLWPRIRHEHNDC